MQKILFISTMFLSGAASASGFVFTDSDPRPITVVSRTAGAVMHQQHSRSFDDYSKEANPAPVPVASRQRQSAHQPANQGEVPKISKRPGDMCTWEEIGSKWGVSPNILYAIAKTESSFNPRAINRSNSNGSEDVGLMQINSFWYRTLAKKGYSREDLFDPCVSLDVAGWIMHDNMGRHGNTWKAVGAYNAVTPWKQERYVAKVFSNLP
jgi:soluble lytic murein transglycosylase-like protein